MSSEMSWDDSIPAKTHAAGMRGVHKAAEWLRTKSVENAPIDEGTLRASAVVETHDDFASVSFNTPYAVRQHEEVGWRHPKGGKAKYLEGPLNDGQETIKGIIAAEIRRSTG